MKTIASRLPVPFAVRAGCVALVLLPLAGCNNIFLPKHRVLVDAIAAPGLEQKLSGLSYRLIARKSAVANAQEQISVIKACVDAALAGRGMFEAPGNAAPDLFIEVGFGVDTTPRVEAASRETFLQLSARTNPTRSLEKSAGPEIWDVRVAIRGVTGRMEAAMPLLATVASEHIGTDSKLETNIEIPQSSPAVKAVREGAITTLEGKRGAVPGAAGAAVKGVTTR
ncbi:MAG: hypothetical protein RIR76_362 [Verrucomicrobiota bacterium]|jgi:hypothetical protein|nr:hypothetical protein [Opitutaceae bacterium]